MSKQVGGDYPRRNQIFVASGCTIDEGKVLLIRRSEPSIPEIDGKWEFPGGKIEFGEDPAVTVEREIVEETGYLVEAGSMLPFPYVAKRHKGNQLISTLLICFRCTLKQSPLARVLPVKVADVKWFDLTKIEPLNIQSGTLQFLRYLKEAELINIDPTVSIETTGFISLRSVDQHLKSLSTYEIDLIANLGSPKLFQVRCSLDNLHGYSRNFESRDELIKFLKVLLKTLSKEGYEIVDNSDNIISILPMVRVK